MTNNTLLSTSTLSKPPRWYRDWPTLVAVVVDQVYSACLLLSVAFVFEISVPLGRNEQWSVPVWIGVGMVVVYTLLTLLMIAVHWPGWFLGRRNWGYLPDLSIFTLVWLVVMVKAVILPTITLVVQLITGEQPRWVANLSNDLQIFQFLSLVIGFVLGRLSVRFSRRSRTSRWND